MSTTEQQDVYEASIAPQLQEGDALLVHGSWSAVDQLVEHRDVLVVNSPDLVRRQTVPLGAMAQTYPAKPITMIVPFAAGGPTDVVARIVTEGMSKQLGQSMVIENRPGASTLVALENGFKAAGTSIAVTGSDAALNRLTAPGHGLLTA